MPPKGHQISISAATCLDRAAGMLMLLEESIISHEVELKTLIVKISKLAGKNAGDSST